MSNKRNDRRKQRRAEAEERARRNIVVDCQCGNRHSIDWTGCPRLSTTDVIDRTDERVTR